jgi:HK97 family phage portal protein
MKFFGREVTIKKAAANLLPVRQGGGWWGVIRESFTGAWQQNVEINQDTVLSFSAVFSCVTLIASDIGKLRIKLVEQDDSGIWNEVQSPSFSPVLRKPNRFQTRIKFIEQWIVSKLVHGNTYVLKERDARGIVVAMYILDPCRVTPLVAPDGAVYYQLKRDDLSGITGDDITVPASEIIHDTMVALFHPLVGISPIYACGLAATQGIRIQTNSAKFFGNNSNPGGILTAPGAISDDTAARMKAHWDANYSGDNAGKVAVLGDGLKFEGMAVKATDAQLIEQLKWTAETVCSCFHVPGYKIQVGETPTYANAQVLNQIYYADCLQSLIENLELLLDEGLGLTTTKESRGAMGTELDLDGLLRMDTQTQIKTLSDGVAGCIMVPNEARKKLGLQPVPGGDALYMQQQNWSLEQLSKRDINAPAPVAPTAPALPPPAEEDGDPEASAAKHLVSADFMGKIGMKHA